MKVFGGQNVYEIQKDVSGIVIDKDVIQINYKAELDTEKYYTPVFTIHDNGDESGLLEKTEYFRDFVDAQNPGTLVLEVSEVYVIDDSDLTIPFTARPVLSRTKTWSHAFQDGSGLDNIRAKTKSKLYNTGEKQRIEGYRRRTNVKAQYIDNVGLAGVLSGAFTDTQDAYNKLTEFRALHSSSVNAWLESGRDPIYTDVQNDSTTGWLDTIVPDTPQTQAMCAWMIGMDLRTYTIDKLKGNIK